MALEKDHAVGKMASRISIGGEGDPGKQYVVDFAAMQQCNAISGIKQVATWYFLPHNKPGRCEYNPTCQKLLEESYQRSLRRTGLDSSATGLSVRCQGHATCKLDIGSGSGLKTFTVHFAKASFTP